jgi:hypothetical protein
MKVLKFNEKFDYINSEYREYDEYSVINMNILNEWKHDFDSIKRYLDNLNHDIRKHNDWIRNYVITDKYKSIIANDISLFVDTSEITIYFRDTITKQSTNLKQIKEIKTIEKVAETNPILFLELYDIYITKHKASYMDIFGKEEFKYILDTKKYNL